MERPDLDDALRDRSRRDRRGAGGDDSINGDLVMVTARYRCSAGNRDEESISHRRATNLQQAMADSVAADGIKEDSYTSPPTRQRLTGDDTETTRTAQWGSETGVAFAKEQMISSHVLRKTASNQIRVGGTAVQTKRRSLFITQHCLRQVRTPTSLRRTSPRLNTN